MRLLLQGLLLALLLNGCSRDTISEKVQEETIRTWKAYERYGWPNDHFSPITGVSQNWYENSLFMSPIDGYSTLKLMGYEDETDRIERFVQDSLRYDKDVFVKVFEVNIRILGGLLYMYENTGNPDVLAKAKDFGDRLLKAFDSPTGLPYYYVNLRTGEAKGDTVNLAECGSYAFEFGILSYYSKDPKYYQAAKNAIIKLNALKSPIGLFGRDIDVTTGEWTQTQSMVGAYADSYFEYLYKSWLLFGDEDLKMIWDDNIAAVKKYLSDRQDGRLWFCKADMYSGEKNGYDVTVWDAYFPALLVLSGDIETAALNFDAWQYFVDRYAFPVWSYHYPSDSIINGYYQLNPETLESAYYLYVRTSDEKYYNYARQFLESLEQHCRTDIAYCHIKDVRTMEKDDQMETFFIAETMKYLYLIFNERAGLNIDDYVFSTEAHPFKKSNYDRAAVRKYLAL